MMGFDSSSAAVWMWLMGLFGLLFLGGIVWLLIWTVRTLFSPNRLASTPASADALSELKLRLARGEITPDEYETLRAHLQD